jgi:hypothetical protein
MSAENLETLTPVEFNCRKITKDGLPNFSVSSVASLDEEIRFDRSYTKKFEIELPESSALRIIIAAKKVKQAMFTDGEYNCAWFAHVLADTPVIGDINEDPAPDWNFHGEVPIDKLRNMDVGRILNKRFVTVESAPGTAMPFGHWHTIVDRSKGLSLHVDGWQGPLLLTPTSSMVQAYPAEEFLHLHVSPDSRLQNRIATN